MWAGVVARLVPGAWCAYMRMRTRMRGLRGII